MKLYLEGEKHLRPAMSQFIQKATGNRISIKVITSGPRDEAISHFVKDSGSLLLIDSEGEELTDLSARLASRISSTDALNQAFFMVQVMETWFLADKQTLAKYFGQGFNPNALPKNPNVECIPKQDIIHGLQEATRRSKKGEYRKTKHDAALLGLVDHATVYRACPNFARLITYLREQSISI
jgi:hypothetical protein